MAISKQEFSGFIKSFNFRELFNIMGWNNDKTQSVINYDNLNYKVVAVAEKSGFKILNCLAPENAIIPDYITRRKIESQITKLFQEHLIIFTDSKRQEQIWQFVVRQAGKPTKVTETRYSITQDPELLYQRASGVFFEMDEEDSITIVDVTSRMKENFHANAEKVTKQFYDKFKKQHTSFLTFIKGIDEKVNQEWYASLMLNRLMFCYFIQKKGFLDNNRNYLREKLNSCQAKKGKNKFYSFYRDFLLVLFHQGLNESLKTDEVKAEIGRIPYLNGGLFDEHELEKMYKNIVIEDKAFERIFDFFDEYEWHLDTRVAASGKDINPDVIGYIFEKYINDRAQMGAYYTKEDITDYIGKNCIIPYLFDETKRSYKNAFAPDGPVWETIKASSDAYIYDAVKKGVEHVLPDEIAVGINEVSQRTEWNKTAPVDYALPTEIWREVIERRNRYFEIKAKIEAGEIQQINDLITYNLNIRQFAQDVIENTNDPDFARKFYKSISTITILDPTCGSGAFLFAAMNILEPLYEACIMRMRAFVEDEDRLNEAEGKSFSHKFSDFRNMLSVIQNEHHPNLKYYIFKSIILQNLFGVDIMKEAVEIAKLRLFLKLVATVEVDYRKPNLGLEPLPDIDFNIRAGNTLVGFGTEAELNKGLTWTFDGQLAKPIIEEKCDIVAKSFMRYKEIQLNSGNDYADFKIAKEDLSSRLKELNHELNQLLHKQAIAIPYDKWLLSYQPFHWFAEFYEIMHDRGGFDVIIGNPPYVEYSAIKKLYTVKDFKCFKAGNLYAYVIERCYKLMKPKSRIGMIIQMSAFCTPRMEDFQKVWFEKSEQSYISFFDDRPGKLFDGLEHIRVAICISEFGKVENNLIGTSNYVKFKTEFRPSLFSNLNYVLNNNSRKESSVLKVNNKLEHNIIDKLWRNKKKLQNYLTDSHNNNFVYYGYGYGYFGKILNYQSFFKGENVQSSTGDKFIYINKDFDKDVIVALMNSSLFYWFYVNYSDGHNFTKFVIGSIPFEFPNKVISDKLKQLTGKLMIDLDKNANRKIAFYKATGKVEYDEFYPKKSKQIIDQIDTVLAEHYGFSAEELDFIINYDIKYRMGKELENGEED